MNKPIHFASLFYHNTMRVNVAGAFNKTNVHIELEQGMSS